MPSGPSIAGRVPTRSLHLLVLTLLIALIPWLTAAPAHAADNSVLGIVVRTATPGVAGYGDERGDGPGQEVGDGIGCGMGRRSRDAGERGEGGGQGRKREHASGGASAGGRAGGD